MNKKQAAKRLKLLTKLAFDKKYKERKEKLFKRIFRNKTPSPLNMRELDEEAKYLIQEHFPEMIPEDMKE